jgi:hypothetical protein
MKLKVPEIICVRDRALIYPRINISLGNVKSALHHCKDQTISLTFKKKLKVTQHFVTLVTTPKKDGR